MGLRLLWVSLLPFLLLLCVLSRSAFAQTAPAGAAGTGSSSSRHGVGFGFGDAMLPGGYNSDFSSGIGFNLNYDFESGPTFGLLVDFHWNTHSNPNSTTDSLGFKGLNPNVKVNVYSLGSASVYGLAGLGLYQASETLGAQTASLFLFGWDLGVGVNIDVDPHFRFGPSLTYTRLSTGTDNSSATTAADGTTSGGLVVGGAVLELMFSVMYFF